MAKNSNTDSKLQIILLFLGWLGMEDIRKGSFCWLNKDQNKRGINYNDSCAKKYTQLGDAVLVTSLPVKQFKKLFEMQVLSETAGPWPWPGTV